MGILAAAYSYAQAHGIDPYTAQLASTIQGESATQSGQFAVAATMQNRVTQGIDTDNSLTSVGSYEANNHFTTPSPFALQQAQALQDGRLSDYGDVGNATYYNAAGSNSAYDAGGVNIGGNMYSDRYNQQPSTNFIAPSYNPAQANSAQTQADQQQDAQQDGTFPDTDYNPQTYTQNNGAGSAGELPSFAQGPGGASDPYYSSGIGSSPSQPYFTNMGTDGSENGPDTGSEFSTINPNTYTQNNGAGAAGDVPATAGDSGTAAGDSAPPLDVPVGSGEVGEEDTSLGSVGYTDPGVSLPSGSADSSDGTDSGMDVPSAIDGLAAVEAANTNATNKSLISAADTQAKASANSDKVFQALGSQLTKQLQQATTQQTSTAQDIRTSLESFTTNLFVRGFLIVLGLIFVAVALSFFKPVQDNVVQPIARGSRKVAKMTAEAA